MKGSVDRRLAAILVTDMEQYSRLMHEDERGTVEAWQNRREEVIKPTIASHLGNIIKNTGDGFVAEFATVSGAFSASSSSVMTPLEVVISTITFSPCSDAAAPMLQTNENKAKIRTKTLEYGRPRIARLPLMTRRPF